MLFWISHILCDSVCLRNQQGKILPKCTFRRREESTSSDRWGEAMQWPGARRCRQARRNLRWPPSRVPLCSATSVHSTWVHKCEAEASGSKWIDYRPLATIIKTKKKMQCLNLYLSNGPKPATKKRYAGTRKQKAFWGQELSAFSLWGLRLGGEARWAMCPSTLRPDIIEMHRQDRGTSLFLEVTLIKR